MPALGGPASTASHSSGVKSALVVMRSPLGAGQRWSKLTLWPTVKGSGGSGRHGSRACAPASETNMMTLGRVLASTTVVTVATAAALLAAGEDNARAAGTSCDAALVRVSPKRTSVDTLRTLRPPRAQVRRTGAGARSARRVYRVEAHVAGMRASGNAIDVVLEQPGRPGHQIIASFSGDACRKSRQTAKLRAQIAKARAALLAACGAPAAPGVTVA